MSLAGVVFGRGVDEAGGPGRLACAWSVLESVLDPEVPVVSVVDLGIVRDVVEEGEALVVVVTMPPATFLATITAKAMVKTFVARVCIFRLLNSYSISRSRQRSA